MFRSLSTGTTSLIAVAPALLLILFGMLELGAYVHNKRAAAAASQQARGFEAASVCARGMGDRCVSSCGGGYEPLDLVGWTLRLETADGVGGRTCDVSGAVVTEEREYWRTVVKCSESYQPKKTVTGKSVGDEAAFLLQCAGLKEPPSGSRLPARSVNCR